MYKSFIVIFINLTKIGKKLKSVCFFYSFLNVKMVISGQAPNRIG